MKFLIVKILLVLAFFGFVSWLTDFSDPAQLWTFVILFYATGAFSVCYFSSAWEKLNNRNK